MTLQEVDEAITALERALADGSESVRYSDRWHTYRSVSDIREALHYFRAKRNELTGNRKANRFSVARFNA